MCRMPFRTYEKRPRKMQPSGEKSDSDIRHNGQLAAFESEADSTRTRPVQTYHLRGLPVRARDNGEVDALKQEVSKLKEKLDKTKQSCKLKMTEQNDELQLLHQVNADLQQKLHDEHARAEHASRHTAKQDRELDRLRQECSALRTFADATDECSEAEVVGAMNDINAKISQLAASLSDQWETAISRHGSGVFTALSAQHRAYLDANLGRYCAYLLYNQACCPPAARHSLIIQYAVQTFAVGQILFLFKCFVDGQPGSMLDLLYDKIFSEESHVTSSRWRALTSRYLRRLAMAESNGSQAPPRVINLNWDIELILVAAGVHADAAHRIVRSHRDEIVDLMTTAAALSTTTKERVISTRYDAFGAMYGQPFLAESLDDITEQELSEGRPAEHFVWSTVELGLRYAEGKSNGDTDGGSASARWGFILKPKVLVHETALRILQPPLDPGQAYRVPCILPP